jgi:cytochrome c
MRKLARAAAAAIGLGAVMLAVPVWAEGEPDALAPEVAAPEASEADTVAKGRAILDANCHRCHAIGMEDTSHHEEAPPFRVVVTRYPPEDLAEALAEGIVSGHPDMPEFVFQPDEIEAILAYLGTLMPEPNAAPDQKDQKDPKD